MKLKKRKDQSVDARSFLEGGKGGNTEITCEAETQEKAAPPGDPSHVQISNLDTIVDASKCLLTGG